MPAFVDLTGQKFGRLTVVSRATPVGYEPVSWHCLCDCGSTHMTAGKGLRSGESQSCGCRQKELVAAVGLTNASHRMCGTREYSSWSSMKDRCLNPNDRNYHHYGGRGITVCERWLVFESFYEDMGPRPEGTTLDRERNAEGYYKGNCRWATGVEQGNNRRDNHLITYDGQTLTITEWSRALGIDRRKLNRRILDGWDVARAFNLET